MMGYPNLYGETGATMERIGEEEGLLPERSEWFRSRGIIGTRDRVSQGANTVGFCSETTGRPRSTMLARGTRTMAATYTPMPTAAHAPGRSMVPGRPRGVSVP